MENTYYIEFDESVFAEKIPFRLLAEEGLCSRESSHLFTLKTERSLEEITDLLTSCGYEKREFTVYDEKDAVITTR